MQGDLLWTYEGQDQFWGLVLSARSGLQGKPMVLGQLAAWAGQFSEMPGRGWRSVEDTGNDPVFANRKPKPFPSLSRNEDYYTEGALVWLEIDQMLRQGTNGAKSIDDFARSFFGMNPGDWGQLAFEADEIVTKLDALMPYDWAGFIAARINSPGQGAPVGGIDKGGYRLVWKDEPNPFNKAVMANSKGLSLYHSIGLTLDKDGKVTASRWDGPAFNAGIVNGAKIVAVNGEAYSADAMKAAITAARATGTKGEVPKPVELLVQRGTRYLPVSVAYHGGLRWPWLERAAPGSEPTGLDRLLTPRRPGAPAETPTPAK